MDYAGIQDKLDTGRGKAAQRLGPPCDVYRVQAASSGDVIAAGNKINSGVPVYWEVGRGDPFRRSHESLDRRGIVWYRLVADFSTFLVGDVFVINDPVYGVGATEVEFSTSAFNGFALAAHAPVKQTIGARLNWKATISRPASAPDSSGSWGAMDQNAQPLVLSAGTSALGAVGATGSKVPIGIQLLDRPEADGAIEKIDTGAKGGRAAIYVPPLPGWRFIEGDMITLTNGAIYRVMIPMFDDVGLVGSQLVCVRVDSETPGVA